MSGKKRSIREHRTAAKAWDAARATAQSSRAGDRGWSQWAKSAARSTRRQLKASDGKRGKP